METEQIDKIVSDIEPELRELSKYIHDNPELGLQEYRAYEAQIKLLKKYGFEIEEHPCQLETAYIAKYKSNKKGLKIAMVAEYDALPEIGHGCGHNLIAMVGVGSGIAMRSFADQYGGEIYVIGTPAEETWGTKVEMARHGIFDKMDVAMMAHPMDIETECMNTMALKSLLFKFYGKPAHAAAAPFEGVNALDAVVNFYNMVNALRQQTRDDARIHGYIKKGGSASNVIPDFTETEVLVRANKMEYLEGLTEKVINCAKGAALGTGCKMEYEKADQDFMDTDSNLALGELYACQMEKQGVKITRTKGKPISGSSDFGDVSYRCPAIQSTFNITGDNHVGAHTREFTELAVSPKAMDQAIKCIKGFAMTATELMRNPGLLKKIKNEFDLKQK